MADTVSIKIYDDLAKNLNRVEAERDKLKREKGWLFRELIGSYNRARNPQPPLEEAREYITQRMQQALKEGG